MAARRRDGRCDQQHQRPGQYLAEHGNRIGADTEEGGRCQRHVRVVPENMPQAVASAVYCKRLMASAR